MAPAAEPDPAVWRALPWHLVHAHVLPHMDVDVRLAFGVEPRRLAEGPAHAVVEACLARRRDLTFRVQGWQYTWFPVCDDRSYLHVVWSSARAGPYAHRACKIVEHRPDGDLDWWTWMYEPDESDSDDD